MPSARHADSVFDSGQVSGVGVRGRGLSAHSLAVPVEYSYSRVKENPSTATT